MENVTSKIESESSNDDEFPAFTVPAFAKINWDLRVLGRRDDGFHEICTTFQTVSLCDYLTFETSNDLTLTCDVATVPTDANNLILRAANALRERFDIKKGAKIHLEKRIPSPGGLGGGSSDAAIALLSLAKLWQIEISRNELSIIGSTLGADVPFFLHGGTAFGSGLGTQIEPLRDVPKKLLLIVTPDEDVSTAAAYKSLNAPRLTRETASSILHICRLKAERIGFHETDLQNDFEKTIFALKPEIKRAKNALLENGANFALMSGSGASVFAIFDNETTRRKAFSDLCEQEKSWRIFECETISQIEYQKSLSQCWNRSIS